MKRAKRWIALLLTAALTLGLAGCSAGEQATGKLRLGTGGIGGTYYTYGNALNQLVTGESEEMMLTVKSTAGSAANIRLMSKGFLEMAIVQSDILMDAAAGQGLFEKDGALGGYSAVAGLYTEACQIVVPAGSDIQTVADLQGKCVSVGEEESGVVRNAQQILQAYGLTFQNMDVKYLSFADSAAAMEAGEIDAFFCTAGAPTAAVTELARNTDIRLLSVDAKQAEQMMSLYGGLSTCRIPAGTYPGQDADVETMGVKAVLIAGEKVSPDTVKKVTETIFGKASELKYATGANTDLDMDYATQNIPVGFHSGAAEYYKSQGIDVTEGAVAGGTGSVSGSQDK